MAEALRSPTPPPPERTAQLVPNKPLTARLDDFSLHAGRFVPAFSRAELERLCSYGLRPPFSAERFSLMDDGKVRYQLAKPTASGHTELRLEPLALLRRLTAILPAPFARLVRSHGVFSPRSRFRHRLPRPFNDEVPEFIKPDGSPLLQENPNEQPEPESTNPPHAAESKPGENPPDAAESKPGENSPDAAESKPGANPPDAAESKPGENPRAQATMPPRRKALWAQLLRRVLQVDALECPKCAAPMVVLAFISDPEVVTKILKHLNLDTTPAPLAPAREPYEEVYDDVAQEAPSDDFSQDEFPDDEDLPTDRGS